MFELILCMSVLVAARADEVEVLRPYGPKMCEAICQCDNRTCEYNVNTLQCSVSANVKINSRDDFRTLVERNDDAIRTEFDCAVLRNNKLSYKGTKSVTVGGHQCQRWDNQYPHTHNKSGFVGESLAEVNNYCRTPDDDETSLPWCYTTSPEIRWQACEIAACNPVQDSDSDCYSVRDGIEIIYNGTRNTTVSGLHCQRWDRQTPHKQGYTFDDFPSASSMEELSNHCQVPLDIYKNTLELPWCYTIDPKVRWEVCVITHC